jgi:hypothetical protein
MKTSLIKIAPLFMGMTMLIGWACTKEYDFEKLSGMIQYDPAVDAPLAWGSLTAKNLFASWDSLMENNGDTVVLVFREDSIFYYDATDLSGIPPQDTSEFNLISLYTYPVMPADSFIIDSTENMQEHWIYTALMYILKDSRFTVKFKSAVPMVYFPGIHFYH